MQAIYLSEAYKTEEYAMGSLIARGSGESYSIDNHQQGMCSAWEAVTCAVRFWDFADVLYPPTEVGAIFIASRCLEIHSKE